jgi:pimeloyl-ACP methyl ester carboxylesterase
MPEGYGVVEAAEDVLAFMVCLSMVIVWSSTSRSRSCWQDALSLPSCHFVAMDYGSPIALQIAIAHPGRVLSLFLISQTCLEEVYFSCNYWSHRQLSFQINSHQKYVKATSKSTIAGFLHSPIRMNLTTKIWWMEDSDLPSSCSVTSYRI